MVVPQNQANPQTPAPAPGRTAVPGPATSGSEVPGSEVPDSEGPNSDDGAVAAGAIAAAGPGADVRSRRGRMRVVVIPVGCALLGGLAVGLAWALLTPVVVRSADPAEQDAARDVTLGLLGILAGLIAAMVLVIRPGPRPVLQVGVTLGAVTGASFLAWAFGLWVGAPTLHSVAIVLVWPLVAAAAMAIRSLVNVLGGTP